MEVLDIGTYGSSPAARNLTRILDKYQDIRLVHLVSKEIQKCQKLIAETLKIENRNFAINVLRLIREDRLNQIDKLESSLSRDIFTHMRTAVVTDFRNALASLRMKR